MAAPVISPELKKYLVWLAAGVTLVVIYQACMVMIFRQPAPIKEIEPFVAFVGSGIIAALVAVRVYKDLR